jgi:hypothetical protein
MYEYVLANSNQNSRVGTAAGGIAGSSSFPGRTTPA